MIAPSTGCLVGAYVGAEVQGGPKTYSLVAEFEQKIGRKLAIDSHVVSWDFAGLTIDQLDVAAGRVPLIGWKLQDSGYTARDVMSGRLDGHIHDVAKQLAQIPGPSLLRFMYEMNIHPELGSPSDVIRAWKHVRHIVRPLAPRVEWVQCLTARAIAAGSAQAYYVGPQYCEWVGVDGYNFYPGPPNWTTPAKLFQPFYDWALPLGKPLIICEVGCGYDPTQPGRQTQWVVDLATWITTHPQIKAWCYWEAFAPECNWVLAQGDGAALTAYIEAVNQSYMQPTGG